MDFDVFEALTFDCYGTLIDWERGILEALDAVLGPAARDSGVDDDRLERFGSLEAAAQAGPFRPYRQVLREVALGYGRSLGVVVSEKRAAAFAESVGRWPPFPDTGPSLRRFASRYRLCVVSNVDDDLFRGSAVQLGVGFEHVVTAEQVRAYKPDHAHFHEVMERLGLPPHRILHVAQSLFHDIRPANELGLPCVWVNRRAGRAGAGATPPARAVPDFEVPDLASLVTEMRLG